MVPELRFLSGHWCEPWHQHRLEHMDGWRGPCRYLIARDSAGQPVGAIPLVTQTKAGLQFLALGGYYTPFRGFPVARDEAATVARHFAQYLTRNVEGVGLRFGPVLDVDPTAAAFVDELSQSGWRVVPTAREPRFVLRLPESIDEFWETRSASERKNLRRYERKMCREQQVALSMYTTEECSDWGPVIHDMARVEQASWLRTDGGDLHFSDRGDQEFWNSVLSSKRLGLAARVWILSFSSQPVCFDFTFDSGSCRYSLFAHHAEAVSRYRAGFFLLNEEIRDAIGRGIKITDFGGGDSGYKRRWGSAVDGHLLDYVAFPPGFRGAAFARLIDALGLARQARSQFGRSLGRIRAWRSAKGQ